MKVSIHVKPRAGVRDPQGEAVQRALGDIGFDAVGSVRQGKVFDMEVADDCPLADIEKMCEMLLANPVIETYHIETPASADKGEAKKEGAAAARADHRSTQ